MKRRDDRPLTHGKPRGKQRENVTPRTVQHAGTARNKQRQMLLAKSTK